MKAFFSIGLFAATMLAPFTLMAQEPSGELRSGAKQLSLEQAIAAAFRESPQLRQSRSFVDESRARTEVARASLGPKLDLNLELATARDRLASPNQPAPIVPRERNQYGGRLVLSQNLFAGFSDVNALRYARLSLVEKDAELSSVKNSVAKAVIERYFYIQLLQRKLSAENEVQQLRANQLKDLQSRLQVGRATELELLQARYALQAQKPQIDQLESDIELETMQLVRQLGFDLDSELHLTSSIEQAFLTLTDDALPPLSDAYERSLDKSPKMALIRSQFQAKEAELEREQAKFFPRADLELSAGMDAHLRSEVGSDDSLTYMGAVTVTVPLFSGLSSFSERRQNLAHLQGLKYEETIAREEILLELTRFYQQWRLSAKQAEAEGVNVALAEETIVRARSLFQAGRATINDLLDGYATKLQANQALAEAKYHRIQAAMSVRALLGELHVGH